jgi:hypothetical protein
VSVAIVALVVLCFNKRNGYSIVFRQTNIGTRLAACCGYRQTITFSKVKPSLTAQNCHVGVMICRFSFLGGGSPARGGCAMRWQGRAASENVEDRRALTGSGLALGGGGGLVMLILLLVGMFFGINPLQLIQIAQQQPNAPRGGAPAPADPAEEDLKQFVAVVLRDTEDVWERLFREQGRSYENPRLVLFSGRVESACGFEAAASGPFYCPADERIFIDLGFSSRASGPITRKRAGKSWSRVTSRKRCGPPPPSVTTDCKWKSKATSSLIPSRTAPPSSASAGSAAGWKPATCPKGIPSAPSDSDAAAQFQWPPAGRRQPVNNKPAKNDL